MRSLKTGLVSIAITGLIATAAMVGCSAEGADVTDLGQSQNPTEPPPPTMGAPTSNDDTNPPPADDTQDAGKSSKDAGVDSGPPAPNPGDACTDGTKIFTKSCLACGKQSARCQIPDGQTTGTVTDYGVCENQKQDGCVPGTTQACGNCGTQTCTTSCSWGTCSGQGTCKAGAIDYTTAGCTTAGTYSSRTCSATCSWGNYSNTCAEPVNANKMTISTTVGSVVSATWTLASGFKGISGVCGSSVSATDGYNGVFVEVKNPSTTKTASISAYHTKATSGTELDTKIAVYQRTLQPTTSADYQSCDVGIEDGCSDVANACGNVTNDYNLAGLTGVTIPPGGKVLVYSVGFSSSITGSFKLNIKTDSLQ